MKSELIDIKTNLIYGYLQANSSENIHVKDCEESLQLCIQTEVTNVQQLKS